MANDVAGNRLCLTGKDWRRITLIESGRLICCIFTGIKHVTVQEPSTPSETAGAAFSLYASVGDAAAMEPITDIGPFIARLEAPDARGLIVYDFPGLVIGQALRAGAAPDEAVEKWRTVTARHLDTLCKFRKKIVLVEAPR